MLARSIVEFHSVGLMMLHIRRRHCMHGLRSPFAHDKQTTGQMRSADRNFCASRRLYIDTSVNETMPATAAMSKESRGARSKSMSPG